MRILLSLILLLFSQLYFSQTILYSTTFEGANTEWLITTVGPTANGGPIVNASPNTFVFNTCSGNGPTLPGTKSAYINDGTVAGPCPARAYSNPSGGVSAAVRMSIDIIASCAGNELTLALDYQSPSSIEDYLQLVYSTDNGSTWEPIEGLAGNGAWTATQITLPSILSGIPFKLGIEFQMNATNILGAAPTIDNVKVISNDLIPPSIICIGNQNEGLSPSCQAIVPNLTNKFQDVSDNCTDSALIIITQIPAAGTILPANVFSTNLTLYAQDLDGNIGTCTLTLTYTDNNPPVFSTCAPNSTIYLDALCQAAIPNLIPLSVAADNCGPVTYIQNPSAGSLVNASGVTTIVQVIATDINNLKDTCFVSILVLDTITANITCTTLPNLYANNVCVTAIPNFVNTVSLSDACSSISSLTITQDPVAGTLIGNNQLVTFTVSGGTGGTRSCTSIVTVLDTIKPSYSCPIPAVLYANLLCTAAVPDYTNVALLVDNCTTAPAQFVRTQTPAPNNLVAHNTTITLSILDAAGNAKTCTFLQTVIDTVRPAIICPGGVSLQLNASCTALLPNYQAIAIITENCSGYSVIQVPAAGVTMTGIGTQPVTLTITDAVGLTNSCNLSVQKTDTIKPIATVCPASLTIPSVTGCKLSVPDLSTSVLFTDNCSSSLVFTQTPTAAVLINATSQIVTYTATDGSGNQRTCSVVVNATDQTAPLITSCALNQIVYATANCTAVIGDYRTQLVATDNCTALPNLTFTQVPPAGTSISSATNVTIYATDLAGNSSSCVLTVVITDTTGPVLTCVDTLSVPINTSCQYTIPNAITGLASNDNCSLAAAISKVQNPLASTSGSGITSILVTATDGAGNSSFCTTVVIPIDNIPATITCPQNVVINNGTSCTYTVPNFASGAIILDNCANFSIAQVPAVGTIIQTGNQNFTLTVLDAGGNQTSCQFNVFVKESTLPILTTCPTNIISCTQVVSYNLPTGTDNCGGVRLVQTDGTGFTSGSNFPIGTTSQSYQIRDSSGNFVTCTFTVTVNQSPSPALISVNTANLCNQSSYLIAAAPITNGTGVWSILQGAATISISNVNATTVAVNGIGFGTSKIIWTVTNTLCGSVADTITIINSQQPFPASVIDTVVSCGILTLPIAANPASPAGVGTWSSSTGVLFSDSNSPLSNASNFSPGWNTAIWTIANGACPVSADTINIFTNKRPTILNQDTTFCGSDATLQLSGSLPDFGQTVFWSASSGSGVIQNDFSTTSTISNLTEGENLIIYGFKHPSCPTLRDTLLIYYSDCDGIEEIIPTMFSPNGDGKNDDFIIPGLSKKYPKCEVKIVNRWGSVMYDSIGYTTTWDGKFKGETAPTGTYFYTITLNDGTKNVINGNITIIQ
jgi:gliding motility-associated-like protein